MNKLCARRLRVKVTNHFMIPHRQPPQRTLIIINNVAARARRAWLTLSEKLKEANVTFDVHETTHRGDAETKTRAALRAGYDTVAIVGGDGTLSEAASGFFDLDDERFSAANQAQIFDLPRTINSSATLAILPAGTGDDFARGLARRRAPLDEWLQRFVLHCRGQSALRAVDCLYGTTNNGRSKFICLNAATLGLGAQVAMRVGKQGRMMQRLPGEARFALAAAVAVARWRERTVRVTVDESETLECKSNLLAVANGLYAGGGMALAPDAQPDDGLLNVLITSNFSRPELLRELARVHRGGHIANPKVRSLRGSFVRIETTNPADELPLEADGDVRGHTPVEFRVIPRALRIVY